MGCARTDELILFSLRQSGIPILELKYPTTDDEGVRFVAAIKKFLAGDVDFAGSDSPLKDEEVTKAKAVSYTHLTLPTIYPV